MPVVAMVLLVTDPPAVIRHQNEGVQQVAHKVIQTTAV
jgi:hypothetical protein